MKQNGISPKLIAAVVAAVVAYLLGQTVLDLPAWAVVAGQAVLVALAAFSAPPGNVVAKTYRKGVAKKLASEKGQMEPLSLLVYLIVVIIFIVLLVYVVRALL